MAKREKMRESRGRLDNSQRRLQRSEVELFAAGIAHEFNNVLGAALGHAEWALDSAEPADMHEALELVVKACERAREITWALKGLAQPREERMVPFALSKLLQEVADWARPFLASDQITLGFGSSPEADLEGDFDQLKEVLINLIKNARDSLCERPAQDPQISLSVEIDSTHVLIRVTDNGLGVPEAFREVIFQPFFTTKGSMAHVAASSSMDGGEGKKLGGGMGLGLYMARNTALEHGGDLCLGSNPSEFTLKLPIGT